MTEFLVSRGGLLKSATEVPERAGKILIAACLQLRSGFVQRLPCRLAFCRRQLIEDRCVRQNPRVLHGPRLQVDVHLAERKADGTEIGETERRPSDVVLRPRR